MKIPRDAPISRLLRLAVLPFLLIMVGVSIWDQRLFFTIMGIWSIYLIAYPLYHGRCLREDVLTASALLLALPFATYAADLLLKPDWGTLAQITELMAVFSVGLFSFLHLVSFHGMRLDRLALTLLCTVSTISMGMLFVLGQYLSNIIFGSQFIADNNSLMISLGAIALGAILMAVVLHISMLRKGVGIIRSLEDMGCEDGSSDCGEGCS